MKRVGVHRHKLSALAFELGIEKRELRLLTVLFSISLYGAKESMRNELSPKFAFNRCS